MALLRIALVVLALGFSACTVPVDEEAGAPDAAGPEKPSSGADAGVPVDATTSADATVVATDAGPCTAPAVESWTGEGDRAEYTEHNTATVTWTLTSTVGCVDTYAPTGVVHYAYYVPGSLCSQWGGPGEHPVDATHGTLTIDRNYAPPRYTGQGATSWAYVFVIDCGDDERYEHQQTGGGVWLEAVGTVEAGAINGEYYVDDENVGYAWEFTAN